MKQLLQKAAVLGSTLAVTLFTAVPAFAAGTFGPGSLPGSDAGGVKLATGGIGFSSLGEAVSTILSFVIFLGALVAFVFLVIGAFRYVSAGDDAAGTKAARVIITNAVVGLILLALVYVIFQIIIRVVPGLNSFFSFSNT